MKKTRWAIAQFFEKWWWNNYLKNKEPNKYLKWKKAYWVSFLQEIKFPITAIGKQCADIGCGPAGIFILSENTNSKWKAVDPLLKNYQGLEIFKPKKYPNVNFENVSFEDYKPKHSFNTIFCINAINHFINLDKNLKKLFKILENDGNLILSTDAHNYKFLKWILYTLPFDILHPHQYTLAEYKAKIEAAGFKIEAIKLKKKEFIFSYYVFTLKKPITD
ncbi:MAG: methyltransferase domain-containing protein [Chitinophagales bacterium]